MLCDCDHILPCPKGETNWVFLNLENGPNFCSNLDFIPEFNYRTVGTPNANLPNLNDIVTMLVDGEVFPRD
jgi:hypothetical protein